MGVESRPFLPRAGEAPDEVAIVSPVGSRTWAELERSVRRYANGLAARGHEAGDRVAVLSRNRPEYIEVLLGNLRAGARHVPLNWHLTAQEITYVLEDSGARLLIADEANAATAHDAARAAGLADVLVFGDTFDAWLAAQPESEPTNTVAGAPLMYTSGTTGRQKGVVRTDATGPVDQVVSGYRRVGDVWGFTDGGVHRDCRALR